MEKVYHVGMDVHKETVEISIFCGWDEEPYLEKRMEAVSRTLRNWKSESLALIKKSMRLRKATLFGKQ